MDAKKFCASTRQDFSRLLSVGNITTVTTHPLGPKSCYTNPPPRTEKMPKYLMRTDKKNSFAEDAGKPLIVFLLFYCSFEKQFSSRNIKFLLNLIYQFFLFIAL